MFVSQPLAQARYDICKQCDQFDRNLLICNKCHCQMKIKVKFIASVCPLSKWLVIEKQVE